MTNQEFYSTFDTEEKCVNYIKSFYESSIKSCPKCNSNRLKWKLKYRAWRCSKCGTKTSLKSISFMRDSNKCFSDWLEIIHMLCHTKKANSIAEVHRHSKQTRYETVYHMVQKIRNEMGRINLNMRFHYQTKIKGLKAVKKKLNILNLYIQQSKSNCNDHIHIELPLSRTVSLKQHFLRETQNYPYPKLRDSTLKRKPVSSPPSLPIHNKHKRWLTIITENIQKQLKGIFHFVSDKHVQGILDEYAFKYNHRLSLDATMYHFFEEGIN